MTKRILAVVCAMLIFCLSFVGCKSEVPQSEQPIINQTTAQVVSDTSNFKLSYTQSDSLNPYESDSLNNHIVQDLVFDSLFRIDESFETEPELASSYAYTDSKTLRVTIISGLQFSDGSTLDAGSVVSAFEMAKASPYYKTTLSPIESAKKISPTEIEFKLKYPDEYAHKLLTFYIVKKNQGKSKYPIGCGRYIFTEGGGKLFVELNKNYREPFNPRFTKIQLVNVPAPDSINNALNIGNISYAFRDLATEDVSRIKCNKKRVNQNNLVYIGINSKNGVTANASIRRAISLAIDRETIVKSAYQGYGKAASSIFHPSTELGRSTKMFNSSSDIPAAKQAILQSGQKKLSLSLVVNENKNRSSAVTLIKQQLEAVGFSVSIRTLNNKAYAQALKSESFDIYLGETKIPLDMRLTGFFSSKGATRFGINQKSTVAQQYNKYLNGKTEIGKFTLDFSVEMPFIPILYRDAIICYSKAMRGDMQGYYENYFSNIQDWYYN